MDLTRIKMVPIEDFKVKMIVEEFFRKRFPEKNIIFEMKCGYFYEWVDRFKTGHPESFMDEESKRVWKEIKENKGIKNEDLKNE